MTQHRAERLAEEIRRELADIVQNNIRDPRIGFVSFTDVEVTKDLRYAKVFYSVLGDEDVKKNTALALDKAKGFMRTELAHRLSLRYTPELTFKFDQSMTYGAKISELLNRVQEGEKKDEF